MDDGGIIFARRCFVITLSTCCLSRTVSSSGESDSARRIKTEFLVQMDGVGKNSSDVLVLGATNVPWELDAAIRRRFEKRIYIPLPDKESRAYMLRLHIGDTPNDLTDDDFDRLGKLTEGASGSDISVLVREALMEPLRKCQQAKQFLPVEGGKYLVPCDDYPNCRYCLPKLSRDQPGKDYTCEKCGAVRMTLWEVPSEKLKVPDLALKDFEKALKHSCSSVSSEELGRFVVWTQKFGQEGS